MTFVSARVIGSFLLCDGAGPFLTYSVYGDRPLVRSLIVDYPEVLLPCSHMSSVACNPENV